MTESNSSDSDNLVTDVVDAFERMHVPPAPSASPTVMQTVDWLARAGVRQSRRPIAMRIARLTTGQRIAACSLGISAVVGVLMLLAFASGKPLSAMERMAKKLHKVKSYSYKLSTQNTFIKEGRTQPTSVNRTGTAYWLDPGFLFAEERIVHSDWPTPDGGNNGELVVHITEIYSAGRPGILIDHRAKTFRQVPELRRDDIPTYSPINKLRMVREGLGEVLRDLGTKNFGKKLARGYVMTFKNARPGSGLDAVQVWVDPDTDLPLEFAYTIQNDAGPESFRVMDCRWNIVLDERLFEPTPPKGYTDITPPESTKDSEKRPSS